MNRLKIEREDIERIVESYSLIKVVEHKLGAGGQHISTTPSGITVTFEPLGLSITSTEFRSQYKNKAYAIEILVDVLEKREDLTIILEYLTTKVENDK